MQSFVSRCAIASLSRPPPQALQEGRRYQTQHSLGSSRDKHRGQPNADPTTGNQVSIVESPDLTHHLQFGFNNLEHVKIPDVSDEHRRRTDMEKERAMQKKFGNMGPGEQLTQSSPQKRRKMLQEQQDVDGLPWEVRWKKSLIPTSEEVVQDIRDRFDLYIQDPIDREQEWYLHWKDRSFKVQKDRMIWPQGYTDYLDHYDEHGRRRVLPSDQRWSDSSWKHLADTKYKDRMWLIEGEERKAVHQSLQTQETLIEEEEQRQLEMGDVYHGIISGVVDLDPDQTYQALSGTANPLEVAKTKMKIQTYGAYQALQSTSKTTAPVEIDPISGLPKSGMEPLPSGITVEQGAAIAAQGAIQYEMLEQEANAASNAGADPAFAVMKAHTDAAKKSGDQPIVQSQVEARMAMVKEQAHHAALGTSDAAARLERTMETIESPLLREAEAASSTPPPQSNDPTTSATEGYMSVESRPDDAEPNVPGELYRVPQSRELGDMPQWYRETLVETEPLIRSYGLVGDPLEAMQPEREFYTPPLMKEEDRITNDDAAGGGSVFDQEKLHKLRSLPELVEGFKPLPLYRDAASSASVVGDASTAASALTGADGKPLKKSERLKRERLERLRKSKLQYDPDVLLPSLPWETDSVVDPYRGIAKEDAIDFNKKDLELSWKAYRDTFQQCITEFGSLTQVTSEEKCERMLFDTMDRFRSGMVGDHPAIPEEAEDVLRLVFEAHTKHFLGDFYKYKGNRLTEAKTVKSEADELLRRASAKSKLLGQNFMNFIQEMTSLELDTIRKNPVQRYVVLVRDKKYESLAKPFMKWMQNELSPFNATQFESYEQLETHREFLMRHVNEARRKCPNRVEGISDSARDGAVEAFYHWCRGALCFYAGKHLHRMFIDYAETRFRSRAEELFEDSIEWFGNYASAAKDVVQIPIPEADPPYEYDEKDFLDGESAIIAEISGHLDKAEGLWHSGTSKRWYPMTDETEYMWYNERRGRITLALDISDRCLENVNKKTHPSIHPFPERARIFLEGAPLTQETAEHLWLRYMGDLYYEHSELMMRQGRFQMGHNYREKCLNFYHTAIRTAQERLPTSWTAPVLTTAKYMMRVYVPGAGEVERHVKELETLVDRLFAVPEPSHWVEPFSELPYRLAIVHANIPAYGELITKEVARQLNWQPSNELLMKNMERRSKGFGNLPELDEYYRTVNEVAQRLFRDKILRWRAREREGSDPYLFWTHLYFAFRVHPKDDVERQQLWDIYEPAYLYIYTQCALANRVRGQYLINDALRRICQILTEGNVEQRQTLLTELNKVREKLVHLVDRQEMDRTITSLEAFSKSPTQPPYMYGTGLLYREAVKHERIAQNPLLRTKLASKDYAEMKDRQDAVRAHGGSLHPHTAQQQQQQQQQDGGGCSKFGDEPCDSQAPPTTKQMFSD